MSEEYAQGRDINKINDDLKQCVISNIHDEVGDEEYLTLPEYEEENDEWNEKDYHYDINIKHEDRFDMNENRGTNNKSSTQDRNGVINTKHIALYNSMFNHMEARSWEPTKNKTFHRRENTATAGMGINGHTRMRLIKLIQNQVLMNINGIIDIGKEAVILHGESNPNYPGKEHLPREIAIKVYKTRFNECKKREQYIKDDSHPKEHFGKQSDRTFINMWAEKEKKNLKRIENADIDCPSVIALKDNILLMSFIGDYKTPALKLKYAMASLSPYFRDWAYDTVVKMIKNLYRNAKLVHGDLSEYNILYHRQRAYVIDVAQAVEACHPRAVDFLLRDLTKVTTFFKRLEVSQVDTTERLFREITGFNVDTSPWPYWNACNKNECPHQCKK